MYTASQTILQLCNELVSAKYSKDEIQKVHEAYLFGVKHISGWYRGNGKPLNAHLVGTASLLVQQNASIEEVLAGILHAVPLDGIFLGITEPYELIKQKFGVKVYELVHEYNNLSYKYSANHLHNILESGDNDGRCNVRLSVVKVRLANELEDYVDNALLFYSQNGKKGREWRVQYLKQNLSAFVEASSKIGTSEFSKYFSELAPLIESFESKSNTNLFFSYNGKMQFVVSRVHPRGFVHRIFKSLRRRMLCLKIQNLKRAES